MNHIDLINYLIHQRGGQRYLEISAHEKHETFNHIRCANKKTSFPHASNIYFVQNEEVFDVIFIDGLHTESQTLTDIDFALARLSKGGVIVLHDCMPPDAWHQRELEAFHEGENWNGTSWKAALRFFNRSTYKCFLLDMDWGCGIIDTARTQIPKAYALCRKLDFQSHYSLLLQYKISLASFLLEQLTVFYHLACMGDWQPVFTEQMQQLHKSGFRHIKLTVLGSKEDLQWVYSLGNKFSLKFETIYNDNDLTHFETPAMRAIEAYAHQSEGWVLYLHSKGVSNTAHMPKAKWRRLMMRELVENWEQCSMRMSDYDLIGVNWRDMPPLSHFCGNFWYASTRYLRKLADFNHYYDNPRYNIWDSINNKRLGCEFWIGSSREMPKVLSLACRNVDFCNDEYWKNK